jgi:hypothetical protein
VDEITISPAGDPFTAQRPRSSPGSTRHHRCDEEFLELLKADFGIPAHALSFAFMGCPRAPKRQAIALCEWAARTDDPARTLLAWARKNHRGAFRPCEDVAGDENL